jgi:hypothetical protein
MLRSFFLTCRKIFDLGPPALVRLQRRRAAELYRPWPGLNLGSNGKHAMLRNYIALGRVWTLGPMASTLCCGIISPSAGSEPWIQWQARYAAELYRPRPGLNVGSNGKHAMLRNYIALGRVWTLDPMPSTLCCGIISPSAGFEPWVQWQARCAELYRPRSGLNLGSNGKHAMLRNYIALGRVWTLDPMARTLSSRPPRTTILHVRSTESFSCDLIVQAFVACPRKLHCVFTPVSRRIK